MVFEVLGQNLFDLLVNTACSGFPLVYVKSITRQVLEALDYLHTTCNIIHTDIKPDNICVSDIDIGHLSDKTHHVSVTIADLGNSCWVDEKFCDLIQSSSFRCPEVLLEEDYGTSADIWSTACLAFELATGWHLFPSHPDNREEAENHLVLILELLGGIPKRKILKNWGKFFTKKGKIRHCPKVNARGICKELVDYHNWNVREAGPFADFLLPMLAIDPNNRSSAKDALLHKWLQFL
uniref:non-specific serine/threonine protein kinase n=1 Tax=Strigamia maritima TaxID=126957 RepID=T1J352_STRMM